jgi:hypothetical protein
MPACLSNLFSVHYNNIQLRHGIVCRSAVREEMIVEKGLTPETADVIGTLVQRAGKPKELLAKLLTDSTFSMLRRHQQYHGKDQITCNLFYFCSFSCRRIESPCGAGHLIHIPGCHGQLGHRDI